MLIGVELPITKENVENIDAIQLMKAHDYFLYHTQLSRGLGEDSKEQYELCRAEVVSRLRKFEELEKR